MTVPPTTTLKLVKPIASYTRIPMPGTLLIQVGAFLGSLGVTITDARLAPALSEIDWSQDLPVVMIECSPRDCANAILLQQNNADADYLECMALLANGRLVYGTAHLGKRSLLEIVSDLNNGRGLELTGHRGVSQTMNTWPPAFAMRMPMRIRHRHAIVNHVIQALNANRLLPSIMMNTNSNASEIATKIKERAHALDRYVAEPIDQQIRAEGWRRFSAFMDQGAVKIMQEAETCHPQAYAWLTQEPHRETRQKRARAFPNFLSLLMSPKQPDESADWFQRLHDECGAPSVSAFWYLARSPHVTKAAHTELWSDFSIGELKGRKRHGLIAMGNLLSLVNENWYPQSRPEHDAFRRVAWRLHNITRTYSVDLNFVLKGLFAWVPSPESRWQDVHARLSTAFQIGDHNFLLQWFETCFFRPIILPTLKGDVGDLARRMLVRMLEIVPFHRIITAVSAYANTDAGTTLAVKLATLDKDGPLANVEWAPLTPILRYQHGDGDYVLYPICNQAVLNLLGIRQKHCVSVYGVGCILGESQIMVLVPTRLVEGYAKEALACDQKQRDRQVVMALAQMNDKDLGQVLTCLLQEVGRDFKVVFSQSTQQRSANDAEKAVYGWYEKVVSKNPATRRKLKAPHQAAIEKRSQYQKSIETIRSWQRVTLSRPEYTPEQMDAAFKAGRCMSPTKAGRNAGSVARWIRTYKLDDLMPD